MFDMPPPPNSDPTPLRRDWVKRRRVDANGRPYDELVSSTQVSLSPDGSIDQEQWINELFYDCHHSLQEPVGGRCGEEGCSKISCHRCFTRCARCQVGLCLFHVRHLEGPDGQKLPVCSHCRGALRRRRFWRGFWAALLNPFVSFD